VEFRLRIEFEEIKNELKQQLKVLQINHDSQIKEYTRKICQLDQDNYTLKAKLNEVQKTLSLQTVPECIKEIEIESGIEKRKPQLISYDACTKCDEDVRYFTGVINKNVLDSVFEYFEPMALTMTYWRGRNIEIQKSDTQAEKKTGKKKIDLKNQFFLTLCRIKRGFETKELAHFYGVTKSSVSKIFITWCSLIHAELPTLFPMPSLERVVGYLPDHIRQKYPNLYGILDCTEFKIETPSSLVAQSSTYSTYKSNNTFKVLYLTSATGMILYVSDSYSGKTSDKEIVNQSKVLDLIPEGSHILVDRGFEITNECSVRGITVDIPAFLGPRQQLTSEETWLTEKIANIRIHVERCIRRVRTNHLFDGELLLSMSITLPMVIKVASYLQNFLPPIVKSKETNLIQDI